MKSVFLMAGAFLLLGMMGTVQAGGNVQAGETKASSCAGCHGANGEGKKPFPKLAGIAPKTFVQDLKDFKSGKRKSGVMKNFASKLSDEDMENLAAYYASLTQSASANHK